MDPREGKRFFFLSNLVIRTFMFITKLFVKMNKPAGHSSAEYEGVERSRLVGVRIVDGSGLVYDNICYNL